MADAVEYLVVGRTFVNGSYFEPKKGERITVWAAPGLEGPALLLVDASAEASPKLSLKAAESSKKPE